MIMHNTSKKSPNPQGKGLVPVLAQINHLQPVVEESDSTHNVLMRYIFSRLILNARFSFQPTRFTRYTLYWHNESALLSMISPAEFGADWPSKAVIDCQLCSDLTWQCLHIYSPEKLALIADRNIDINNFNSEKALEELLPFHDDTLPFNQRVLAYGMSRGVSAHLGNLAKLPLHKLLSQVVNPKHTIDANKAIHMISQGAQDD
ncbi:hypothetical protein [Salinibius halmophilus]|uniref:hypothetical protein n=1 Tax=Salinibius halmophilus TaxID=1853216 RepID=UPI000E66CEBE|nr:hypothetical protein [Salinibius halmophilus]